MGAPGSEPLTCRSNSNSCIQNFTANATYFPSGLQALSRELGAGFHLYHHFFCPVKSDNAYPSFHFLDSGRTWNTFPEVANSYVDPSQSFAFYRRIFEQGRAQAQMAFEIDYLSSWADNPYFRSQLEAASQWLGGMSAAAVEAGIPLQLCMTYPRHVLESLRLDGVTQVRASTDYPSPKNFFDFGHTTLLSTALGLSPSKDNFRSKRCSNCNFGGHKNSEMNALLAALSRGVVGISDGPGQSDLMLIRRLVTSKSSRILRPSQSVMALDASYAVNHARRPDGDVWAAQTALPAPQEFAALPPTHFVMGIGNEHSTGRGYVLRREDLGLSSEYMVRAMGSSEPFQSSCADGAVNAVGPFPNSCVQPFSHDSSRHGPFLSLPWQNQSNASAWSGVSASFHYDFLTLYPLVNGFVLLGEMDKYVSVSETRFRAAWLRDGVLEVVVQGDPGEVVFVTALVPYNGKPAALVRVLTVDIPNTGQQHIVISAFRTQVPTWV